MKMPVVGLLLTLAPGGEHNSKDDYSVKTETTLATATGLFVNEDSIIYILYVC